jgi:carbohydrate-binding DOMON domain-containing protein
VYDASISCHTWESGTSYFEYVGTNASFNATATAGATYTEYDCEFDAASLDDAASQSMAGIFSSSAGIDAGPVAEGSYQGAQTVTQTVTQTYTTTITKTVTGSNGEVTTIVETVPAPPSATVPSQGPSRRALLAGAGLIAFLFLLLIAAKR